MAKYAGNPLKTMVTIISFGYMAQLMERLEVMTESKTIKEGIL